MFTISSCSGASLSKYFYLESLVSAFTAQEAPTVLETTVSLFVEKVRAISLGLRRTRIGCVSESTPKATITTLFLGFPQEGMVKGSSHTSFACAQGRRSTAMNASAAAKEGEADKHRWYGEAVAPLIIQTLGRVGKEDLDLPNRSRRAALDYGLWEAQAWRGQTSGVEFTACATSS